MATALVCPDKFRGTLTAAGAAEALGRGLEAAEVDRRRFDEVRRLPLAAGGEGTLDALLAAQGGSRRRARVTGPLGDPVEAEWGLLPDGTGVVESARASGLALIRGPNDPLAATSRGTGELIRAAVRGGAQRILVAVGGSAMTDGGLGAVDALGWSLKGLDVTVACDVATGFVAAAAVFGPQKGATAAQVALLGRRLERLAEVYRDRTGVDVTALARAGAAGGLAGGLAALGARLEPGFEVVARAAGFEAALDGVDLVLTGEGRLDRTSLSGKVTGEVLAWAASEGIAHRAVVAGQVADDLRRPTGVPSPSSAGTGTPVEDDGDPVLNGVMVLSLVDRVWQEGEAWGRAGLLAEEAAVEVGRWALERLG
ncbi:MAG TPA: glycerate kinase [Acidimicrobiia bacterium]|nr:glycerate kinase [Acidimicrobiia bacterium]